MVPSKKKQELAKNLARPTSSNLIGTIFNFFDDPLGIGPHPPPPPFLSDSARMLTNRGIPKADG